MATQVARSLRASARLAVWLLVLTPAAAHAQSTFTGVVKDTSGAVLPGVTVEAASPVLIEKMRSAVTDSTGSYRIVDLRPGAYTLTFTLTGFSIVKRENIELPANFTMTINGEMKVGALEETLTVTGAAPTVDVPNVRGRRDALVDERIGERDIPRVECSELAVESPAAAIEVRPSLDHVRER